MKKRKIFLSFLCFSLIFSLTGCDFGMGSTSGSTADIQTSDTSSGWSLNSYAEADSSSTQEIDDINTTQSEDINTETTQDTEEEADVATNRKIIQTFDYTIETKSLEESQEKLEQAVKEAGGYFEDLNTSNYSYQTSLYATIRIDSTKVETFQDAMEGVGNIAEQSESAEDITVQYTDTENYRNALQTEYDRVLALLETATNMDDILTLESKLSDLRYQIDNLSKQLQGMDNLVDYTTVNITMNEVEQYSHDGKTLGERLSEGWEDAIYDITTWFQDTLVFCVTNIFQIIFFVIVIVVAVVIVRRQQRKLFGKSKKDTDEKPKDKSGEK